MCVSVRVCACVYVSGHFPAVGLNLLTRFLFPPLPIHAHPAPSHKQPPAPPTPTPVSPPLLPTAPYIVNSPEGLTFYIQTSLLQDRAGSVQSSTNIRTVILSYYFIIGLVVMRVLCTIYEEFSATQSPRRLAHLAFYSTGVQIPLKNRPPEERLYNIIQCHKIITIKNDARKFRSPSPTTAYLFLLGISIIY